MHKNHRHRQNNKGHIDKLNTQKSLELFQDCGGGGDYGDDGGTEDAFGFASTNCSGFSEIYTYRLNFFTKIVVYVRKSLKCNLYKEIRSERLLGF